MWEHYNTVNTLVKVFLQTQRLCNRLTRLGAAVQ
jgi:hypothetical protein